MLLDMKSGRILPQLLIIEKKSKTTTHQDYLKVGVSIFCYNKDIVLGNVQPITNEEVISFFKKRKRIIEGLVITGGEPLMQKDIADFCEKIKKIGEKTIFRIRNSSCS